VKLAGLRRNETLREHGASLCQGNSVWNVGHSSSKSNLICRALCVAKVSAVVAMLAALGVGGCSVGAKSGRVALTDAEMGTVRLERLESPEQAGQWEVGKDRLGWEAEPYRLQPGDEVEMRVLYHADLLTNTRVLPDGSTSFPIVGQIQAAGKTLQELEKEMTDALGELLVDPKVSVVVKRLAGNYVFVLGQVRLQGAYEISGPMTVTQALARAGGPIDTAKLGNVLVIRRTSPDSVTGIRVNVDRILKNGESASDRVLRAYDIVYVPKTLIGKIDTFIEQFFAKTAAPWLWYVWYRSAIDWDEMQLETNPPSP
jgi:protein involved in polysaccharide export with SLBB domain